MTTVQIPYNGEYIKFEGLSERQAECLQHIYSVYHQAVNPFTTYPAIIDARSERWRDSNKWQTTTWE